MREKNTNVNRKWNGGRGRNLLCELFLRRPTQLYVNNALFPSYSQSFFALNVLAIISLKEIVAHKNINERFLNVEIAYFKYESWDTRRLVALKISFFVESGKSGACVASDDRQENFCRAPLPRFSVLIEEELELQRFLELKPKESTASFVANIWPFIFITLKCWPVVHLFKCAAAIRFLELDNLKPSPKLRGIVCFVYCICSMNISHIIYVMLHVYHRFFKFSLGDKKFNFNY